MVGCDGGIVFECCSISLIVCGLERRGTQDTVVRVNVVTALKNAGQHDHCPLYPGILGGGLRASPLSSGDVFTDQSFVYM